MATHTVMLCDKTNASCGCMMNAISTNKNSFPIIFQSFQLKLNAYFLCLFPCMEEIDYVGEWYEVAGARAVGEAYRERQKGGRRATEVEEVEKCSVNPKNTIRILFRKSKVY